MSSVGQSARRLEMPRAARAELGLATAALIVVELAIPIITLQVYNRVLPNQSHETLVILIAAGAAAICIEFTLRYARATITSWHGFAFTHGVTRDVVRSLLRANGAAAPRREKSLLNMMGSIGALREFHCGNGFIAAMELASLPVSLLAIVVIGGPLAVVPVAVLAVFTLLSLLNSKSLETANARRGGVDATRYDYIVDTIESAHLVKALGVEPQMTRRYEALKAASARGNFAVAAALTRMFDLSAISANVITYGTIAFGAYLTLYGELSAGALIASILLSSRLMPPAKRALSMYARRSSYEAAKRDVDDLLSMPPLADPDAISSERGGAAGEIAADGVSFAYPGGRPLLRDLSLRVARGEVVSIDGPAGGGATTLLDILAGCRRPDAGEVLIDGRPVLSYAPQDLARHVGYIRTHPTIYRGTIMDNMTRFGEAAHRDVAYVAGLLGVDRAVALLPNGYETALDGGEADPIPPGLKQRIGIVRSLAMRPRIVIFDNADAALDRDSYEITCRLFERLRGKIALVLCTNDDFLKGLASRRLTLADGALAEGVAAAKDGGARTARTLRV